VKKDFEVIDHTADIGIMAHGADLKQVFVNAACGLFSLITDLNVIQETEESFIEVTALDSEALLVNWLNELIYLFETKEILFRRFVIKELTDTELRALAFGEKIDVGKHLLKKAVKAATFHRLKIEKGVNDWKAQVIFDI
jgi:SHS2 domain-containing protein